MPVSKQTYERVALEDPEGQWELVCGRLRSKPGMTLPHNHVQEILHLLLATQLGVADYAIRETTRLRISTGTYYIPDLCVLPRSFEEHKAEEQSGGLEIYDEPMPLVVEVWSPSTGEYDIDTKLPEYQLRGDAEIWRIHPYDKTLIAWRRRPDGGYDETTYSGGSVQPIELPGVTIELDRLFL